MELILSVELLRKPEILIRSKVMLVDYSSDEDEMKSKDAPTSLKISGLTPITESKLSTIQGITSELQKTGDTQEGPLSKRKPAEVKLLQPNTDLYDTLQVSKPAENSKPIKMMVPASKNLPLKTNGSATTSSKKLLPSQVRLKKPNTPIDI